MLNKNLPLVFLNIINLNRKCFKQTNFCIKGTDFCYHPESMPENRILLWLHLLRKSPIQEYGCRIFSTYFVIHNDHTTGFLIDYSKT